MTRRTAGRTTQKARTEEAEAADTSWFSGRMVLQDEQRYVSTQRSRMICAKFAHQLPVSPLS